MIAMPTEALPARIGRYEIVAELGRGSMGRVFRARDPNVDRHVALKVLAPLHLLGAEGEEQELRRRFLLEAQAAGRLSHPGVVMVLDADTDPATGSPYIALELVEGRSLESVLRAEGRLPLARAVEFATEVARALAYAHGEGVIHRDVKPANILISDRGRVKVSDFGIAKLASQSLTVSGQVLGSPFFMSPEQVLGEPIDGRTDLFSLGSVLYRAVTGVVPFGGDSIAGVTFKVVNIDPRPARGHAPEIPAALEAVIDRALAKKPAERFADGAQMAAALEAVGSELRAESPTASLEPPPRPRARATAPPREPAAEAAGSGTVALAGPPPLPPWRAAAPHRAAKAAAARRAAALAVAAVAVVVLAVVFSLQPGEDPAGETAPAAESAAPPAAAGPPAEASLAPPSASLNLVYNNRLASGTISVWVDGGLAWSDQVIGPRNLLKRVAGREVRRTIPVPPGARTVEVRVSGRTAKLRIDAADRIRGDFAADQVRRLRVTVNPLANSLKLTWAG
jgi:serine/threonine-protein kinase